MGTFDLEWSWTEVVGNLGTYYLQLIFEVRGGLMGLSLTPVGSDTTSPSRVRISVTELLGGENTHTSGIRSVGSVVVV